MDIDSDLNTVGDVCKNFLQDTAAPGKRIYPRIACQNRNTPCNKGLPCSMCRETNTECGFRPKLSSYSSNDQSSSANTLSVASNSADKELSLENLPPTVSHPPDTKFSLENLPPIVSHPPDKKFSIENLSPLDSPSADKELTFENLFAIDSPSADEEFSPANPPSIRYPALNDKFTRASPECASPLIIGSPHHNFQFTTVDLPCINPQLLNQPCLTDSHDTVFSPADPFSIGYPAPNDEFSLASPLTIASPNPNNQFTSAELPSIDPLLLNQPCLTDSHESVSSPANPSPICTRVMTSGSTTKGLSGTYLAGRTWPIMLRTPYYSGGYQNGVKTAIRLAVCETDTEVIGLQELPKHVRLEFRVRGAMLVGNDTKIGMKLEEGEEVYAFISAGGIQCYGDERGWHQYSRAHPPR
ncbi:hypothetical protein SBOR_6885 [Sclerotinia borealis F-4128]|uniref:Zn(2)-C6 fungal-type domain-containing protein n=1 Tax=Sclerotinia borealis (strain F-4128) TaxID=1432307 RepID=W9CDT7_SCLBF|nr:hypothetical protein SBOR_6885 [Sclerotinia borealis F-4128]